MTTVAQTVAAAITQAHRLKERDIYESSLIEFADYVWPVVEPAIPFIRGWAIEAIAEHLEAVSYGYIKRLLINVPPGFSKAIDHNEPVLTTWGWKRHGDLKVGDYVFGPDGWPRKILACSEEMNKEAFSVTFDDETSIIAGHDHLWQVDRDVPSVAPRYTRGKRRMVLKTSELRGSGVIKGKVRLRPDSIDLAEGIELPPKNLLIDPYTLGAWLGDGGSAGGIIYAGEQDAHHFAKLGYVAHVLPPSGTRKQNFYHIIVPGLSKKLRISGLIQNKHIPEDYLLASKEQRWELLRGLMDTDGCAAKEGHCSFCNKNEALARDVQRLCWSLGLKAWRRAHASKLNGVDYGQHWLVGFTPPQGTIIFRLDRKQSRVKHNQNGRSRRRQIVSIDPVGHRQMKCIQVEGNLYLVGHQLVPTHNSLMTDVFFPAWEWGPRNLPHLRYMCAAYSNHLTERDNMRCRNVVTSDRYKKFWGKRFGISNEQFTKVKFANDETGWKLATSVAGIGTGERADRLIIDDPNNPMDMESEAIRRNVNMWFTEVMPDRLNNPKESAIVVIQQRTHDEDVSGTALSREMGYTHLMIPMYHDVTRHCVTVIGINPETDETIEWEDPRSEDGELAWPERFPFKIVKDLERDKGRYAWSSQYQQRPAPRGGEIIKEEYWQLWKEPKYPPFEFILGSLDTAYTEKQENDASALTIWGIFRDEARNPKIMLIWAWQDRLEFNKLIQKVIDTCTVGPEPKDHPRFPVDRLLIEAKASGISVGQELTRILRGSGALGVELIDPRRYGDKVARVHGVEHLFADGMIYAPDRAFSDQVIQQCANFPRAAFDDLVDSTSQALRYLRDSGFALRREEYAMAEQDELMYRSPRENGPLYPCY